MNLLEQAEEQERLLDKSAKELEKRKRKEKQLRSQLEQKEAEKLDIEEKYVNLQEEAAGKTKRLKEVWKQFQQTKDEVCTYNPCLHRTTLLVKPALFNRSGGMGLAGKPVWNSR